VTGSYGTTILPRGDLKRIAIWHAEILTHLVQMKHGRVGFTKNRLTKLIDLVFKDRLSYT
jgi:hypothetical protein